MSIDRAATPLDVRQLEAEQERERRAWLARAQADAKRHEAAAAALSRVAAKGWSPGTPVLAVLSLLVAPCCLGIYTWAFSGIPLGPVPTVVPAILLLALLVNVGLVGGGGASADLPDGSGADVGRLAMTVALVTTSCLLVALAPPGIAPNGRVWLGVIGLLAGASLVAMPSHLVTTSARRRAIRHLRLADRAREEAAYLSPTPASSTSGTVARDTSH